MIIVFLSFYSSTVRRCSAPTDAKKIAAGYSTHMAGSSFVSDKVNMCMFNIQKEMDRDLAIGRRLGVARRVGGGRKGSAWQRGDQCVWYSQVDAMRLLSGCIAVAQLLVIGTESA